MTWYFTISCTAGMLACLGSCDHTNNYMYGDTKEECLRKAESTAAMHRLPADKWTIKCEQAATAKR